MNRKGVFIHKKQRVAKIEKRKQKKKSRKDIQQPTLAFVLYAVSAEISYARAQKTPSDKRGKNADKGKEHAEKIVTWHLLKVELLRNFIICKKEPRTVSGLTNTATARTAAFFFTYIVCLAELFCGDF